MSPRIYDETGRIIYGNMYIDPDKIINSGMVDYLTDDYTVAVKAGTSRAGASPIVIKAIGLRDFNSNVIISQADADFLLAANARDGFFAKTAVVFEE
jgi:hypothetical protein